MKKLHKTSNFFEKNIIERYVEFLIYKAMP